MKSRHLLDLLGLGKGPVGVRSAELPAELQNRLTAVTSSKIKRLYQIDNLKIL
jgi:hypothetical protein